MPVIRFSDWADTDVMNTRERSVTQIASLKVMVGLLERMLRASRETHGRRSGIV
jgi:hypothetical protein